MVVPKGFIPDTDNDNFSINIEAAQGTSYYQMVKYQQLVSSIVVQDPDIESFYSVHGRQLLRTFRRHGRMMINTKPRKQRNVTVAEMVNRLRPKLASIPGLARLPLGAAGYSRGRTHVQERLRFHPVRSGHQAALRRSAQTGARLARMPGLQDVISDLQIKTPRVNIVLDRDRAAALHLNWNTISSTLYDAFGPQFASTIYAPNNQYRVLLEMLPKFQQHTDGLDMIYLKSDTGEMVPLNAVAKLVVNAGPQSIPHSGQLPSVTISFALKPGMSLGQATERYRSRRQIHPAGHHHRHLPGHGQGLPGFHAQHGHPADRGHRGGLHRARRALRKLRPPA